MAGFRLTTKVQVSGWRFLLRRLEHAIVRRDTRMFDDPLSFYGRAAALGVVISVLVLVGSLAMAYFKPQGKLGSGNLFVDRATNELYLMVSGRLHPVYNLTSARLVLGSPVEPTPVKGAELTKLPKGQSVGIPGAPYATPVASDPTSVWALCDTVTRADTVNPSLQIAVITMPLADDPSIGPILPNEVMPVSYQGQDWIVSIKGRHATDLSNRSLTSALGIPSTTKPTPISAALFNAIPDAGSWQLPPIANAGAPNTLGLPKELVIGSVLQVQTVFGLQFFVVLQDGVAHVNANTASVLRATETYGLTYIPSVVRSDLVKIPEREYPSPLPDEPIKIVHRPTDPVLCWTWERRVGDAAAPKTTVVAGRHLPIQPSAINLGVKQIQGAATIYTDGGKYVQLQSPDPRYGESLYYVDPQGVRYGIPDKQTATALGLGPPTPAPWEIVRLLVDGPVLSKAAALLEHDTLPADPTPGKLPATPGAS
jgi:type VII secretion protein EccB